MNSVRHSYIGHQGRCFDVRYSLHGEHMISASEDGTAKLWDVVTKKCLFTFDHDKNNEVLRCAFLDTEDKRICTCGSDGNAIIWTADTTIDSTTSTKQSYTKTLTLPHGDSQIYACETLPCVPTEHVMTAAENQIHVWNLSNEGRDFPIKTLNFDVDSTSSASGVETFGGESRNPDRKAYVFDAKPAPDASKMLIAAALSDGTVRVVDLRCQDAVTSFQTMDGGESTVHATSVCWSPDCSLLVGSLGNGDVTLLDLRTGQKQAHIKKAHARSCFGAVFQKSADHPNGSGQFATWSSDGSVRTWDSSVLSGVVMHATDACLREIVIPDYPIYSACTSAHTPPDELLIGGGSSNTSFLGSLVHTLSIFT